MTDELQPQDPSTSPEESSEELLGEAGQPPLITVVVPCFRHGQFLRESVESLISQTYTNLEIVIVNDGSTDNTSEVAKALCAQDSRVKFLNLPRNTGKWFALNTAIGMSSGLIVTCQDADDVALPDRIERQFRTMQATSCVHTLCGFHHCHSEQEVQEKKGERHEGDLHGIEADVVSKMVEYGFNTDGINHYFTAEFETAGTSAMFLKALWNVGFRFNPPSVGLRIGMSEDSDFNLRVTLALRNTVVLAEPLYLYRRWTSTNKEEK